MIDPRDLFPGCYVLYDLLAWEVTGVTEEGIRLYWRSRKLRTVPPAEIEGLPLVPAIMDILGWHRDPVPSGIRYNELQTLYTWVVKFWLTRTELSSETLEPGDITFGTPSQLGSDRRIKSIHELQQQYRWATGQHLKLKL